MLNDMICKNLKPRDKAYKKGDQGGLYLLVQPTGAKYWYLAYRFGGKQKRLSFGQYDIVTLAKAREKRDAAKRLLADGIDPSEQKKAQKRELAAARSFASWADEWFGKKQQQERDPKTIAGLRRYVGYLGAEFGNHLFQAVSRHDVLEFLRSYETSGRLETRDRVRRAGESIYLYADITGSGFNPFRKFSSEQLMPNVSTPRAALTAEDDVRELFRDIAAPFERARFDDMVGHAMRFMSLTVVRPGEIATAEWADFDFVRNRWTIPAAKMKMDKEHVVPLSRQALAILDELRPLNGQRQFIFSCSRDQPISDNTLCNRLRDLGYDTSTEHCAHGFRTTFSTLCNGETDTDDNKMWHGDMIELQLAHLDETSVKAIYNRTGPLSLISARAKLLQHWADRIDRMVGGNVVQMGKRA